MKQRFLLCTLLVLTTIIFVGNNNSFAQDCEQGELIIYQNFDHYTDTLIYTNTLADADFGKIRAYTSGEIRGLGTSWPHKTRVYDGLLRAEYIANAASGKKGGFLFDREFEGVESAMLEYKVKFDENFTWATGGKLPGLGGSGLNHNGAVPSGCVSRDSDKSKNGFSCRLMWRRNRAQTNLPYLILYLYHPNRPANCGENVTIISDIKKNKWYTIKQYIKLNTPGKNDGIIRMYVDGQLLVDINNIQYRLTGKDNVKINALIMNTYRGGSATDPVWWSPNTDYAYFDDFKVWTYCNPVTSVALNKTSTTLTKSETFQLTETLSPSNADNQSVTWSSSNESIATVNANGMVTAIAVGTTTVKVTTADGNYTAECIVEVNSSTGVRELITKKQFTIYPNPNKGNFTISSSILVNAEITIVNGSGKMLLQKYCSKNSLPITGIQFQKGVYVVIVRSNDQYVHYEKLIIY